MKGHHPSEGHYHDDTEVLQTPTSRAAYEPATLVFKRKLKLCGSRTLPFYISEKNVEPSLGFYDTASQFQELYFLQ
jgi:hypothetical protein